jgi:hypothetical protein
VKRYIPFSPVRVPLREITYCLQERLRHFVKSLIPSTSPPIVHTGDPFIYGFIRQHWRGCSNGDDDE